MLGALASTFLSCGGGGGGGGGDQGPPFIGAELNSFPPGAAPPGFTSNAIVVVLDSNDNSIPNASVTMNGVTLAYVADNGDYEGHVVVAPGGNVSLSVAVGGNTYTASANQFASYPGISSPASGSTLDSSAVNTVMWSGGSPTANAEYVLGILDAADPNGLLQWPATNFVQEVNIANTSFSIPAISIPAGDRLMIVGISAQTAIPNAVAGSVLVVEGFNYVPITVTGFPVTVHATPFTEFFPAGIAFSGTQFVEVGASFAGMGILPGATILSSPDGVNWTQRSPSSSDELIGVTWSGTQFVAVGANGTVQTSPDGTTWTTRLAGYSVGGVPARLNAVAWSGTVFAAVGQDVNLGVILTSPDGITWTSRTSGTSSQLLGVAWSGTQFVAVGNGGVILTSPDGTTWTTQAPGNSTTSLLGVAWSGTQFAAVGDLGAPCCSGAILTSPDGITWTPRSGGPTSLNAVAWTGTEFVAVGGQPGVILTSPDGATWTPRASGTLDALRAVAWSGTKLVAFGTRGTIVTSP